MQKYLLAPVFLFQVLCMQFKGFNNYTKIAIDFQMPTVLMVILNILLKKSNNVICTDKRNTLRNNIRVILNCGIFDRQLIMILVNLNLNVF